MTGNMLCFIFGCSSGYIAKTVLKHKCSNNNYQRRIHDVQIPLTPTQNNHLDSLTITQPQIAFPCNDTTLPLAGTEAEHLSNSHQWY